MLFTWTAGARAAVIFAGREKNTCRFCHGKQSREFDAGVHSKFEVYCVSCHGGDGTALEKVDRDVDGERVPGKNPAQGYSGPLQQLPRGLSEDAPIWHRRFATIGYKTSVHGPAAIWEGRQQRCSMRQLPRFAQDSACDGPGLAGIPTKRPENMRQMSCEQSASWVNTGIPGERSGRLQRRHPRDSVGAERQHKRPFMRLLPREPRGGATRHG